MKRGTSAVFGFVGVLIFIGLWDICSRTGFMDPDLFPPLSLVIQRTAQLLISQDFLARDVGSSLYRLATACAITWPLACLVGVLAGRSSLVSAVLSPFFNFTFSMPKVAVFPLLLVTLGLGDKSKIALISIGVFYPLCLNIWNATQKLHASALRDVMKVYGVGGKKLFLDFYFRGLIPDIVVGAKASVAYGFTLVVVSEISASNNGIGNFIWRAWDGSNVLDMYAGVLVLCLLGFLAQTVLSTISKRT
jgi:ABC-type nitrate/sulfonate/bicarbonate transport system permease component